MLLTKPRQQDAAEQLLPSQLAAVGIKTLISLLRNADKRVRILDFAPHNQQNLEFFAQIPNRYYIANVWEAVKSKHRPGTATTEDFRNQPLGETDLLDNYEQNFDLILAWDYLNYLNKTSLRELLMRVGQLSRKGTFFHFLMATQKFMPAEPARISLVDDEFSYQPGTSALTPSPRYSPRAIEKYLEVYRIFKLNLLSNGIQEQVFYCEG